MYAGKQQLMCDASQHVLLSFQDLELHNQDHDNRLWVAEANELTTVVTLSATARAAANTHAGLLQAWCDKSQIVMNVLQDRVRILTASP